MKQFKRKNNRVENFNYGSENFYFITICSKDKECIFGTINNEKFFSSFIGKIVESALLDISEKYENVYLDSYVIMPNHIHFIIEIEYEYNNVTISRIVQQFKGVCAKRCNRAIWHKSFYDHIIRNEKDYYRILEYIDNNILKWDLDEYHI